MQTRRQVVRRSRKASCHSRAAFPSSCADCALCERRIGVHARAVPNDRKRSRVRFDAFDARTEREDLRCQLHSVASMASLPDVQPDRALRASLGAVGRCACDAIAALDDRIPAGKKDFDSIVMGRPIVPPWFVQTSCQVCDAAGKPPVTHGLLSPVRALIVRSVKERLPCRCTRCLIIAGAAASVGH